MKQKYLILCGASGTGKSYIRHLLTTFAPACFSKVEQYTTRKPRKGEDPHSYIFASKEEYESAKDTLIGKCTINGNQYGSIPLPVHDNRAGVIILNEEGLNDFIASCPKDKVRYRIVGIHRPIEEAIKTRAGERSEEYIRGEYEIYKRAEYVYHNDYESTSMHFMLNLFSDIYKLMVKEDEIDDIDSSIKHRIVKLG